MRTYHCWNHYCKKRINGKRITEKEMEKRVDEEGRHIDYCCPECGKVIICERSEE